MDHFEYISALISFVVALGFAEISSSWAHVLRLRSQIRFDSVYVGATGILLLLLIQFWWGFWNFRLVESWTFPMLLSVLFPVGCLVLCSLVLAPSRTADEIDLAAIYMKQRRLLFPLVALTLVGFAVADALISKQPILHPGEPVQSRGDRCVRAGFCFEQPPRAPRRRGRGLRADRRIPGGGDPRVMSTMHRV